MDVKTNQGVFVRSVCSRVFSYFFSDFFPLSSPLFFPMCSDFVFSFYFGPPGPGTRVNPPTRDPTKGGTSLAQTDF